MLEEDSTLVEKVKVTSARWNPLRRVDTLGRFDFNTCVVMLDSLQFSSVQGVSLADLKSDDKIDVSNCERLIKALALAVHEYTHFIDFTSTLWGLRHLRMLHRAYTCDLTDEFKFHAMRTYYMHLKRLKFPDYYTAVNNKYDKSGGSWGARVTAGREFRADGKPGERPILFVRFTNEKDELIVRSPISVISLLETGAMAAEIGATQSLIKRIDDDGQRKVQEMLYSDQLLKYLYDENLTEYSVCAHLVANHFNQKDAGIVFFASGVIARVVLNSSKDVYDVVLKNINVFLEKFRARYSEPDAKAIRRAIGNYDPGALFYVLCFKMESSALDSKFDFAMSLITTMAMFGIHFEKDYKRTALEEAEMIFGELRTSPIRTVAETATAGFENFTRMIGDFGTIDLHNMNLPPVLLGDNEEYEFHTVAHNRLNGMGVEDAYLEMWDGQQRMQQFGDACF